MDTQEKPALTPEQRKAELDALVAQFQKLTDAKERKDFFNNNPRLYEVYSAANFS